MSMQERPPWKSPIIILGGGALVLWAGFNIADRCSTDPVSQQTPATQSTENKKSVQIEKQSYQTGQRVIINDKDQKRPGVFLRPSPAGGISPDTPAVFDGDDVEIIEGPFVTKKQTWDSQGKPINVEKNWWRVRIYFQEDLGRTKVGNQRGAEGWISEEWLGRIIPVNK